MTLHADTLALIQQTAREAQTAKLLDIPGDGRTAYIQLGQTIRETTIEPRPRDHTVHTLTDLILYARHVADLNYRPIIWHSPSYVILILDDNDRRDTVTLNLQMSDPFNTLCTMRRERPALTQREVIRLLRFELGLDNKRVIDQFRRLDWQESNQSAAELHQGKESLGRAITAEVQGIDKLPDELLLAIPIYRTPYEDTPYDIRVGIEIDVQNQRFQIIPLPGQLENAERLAQESIADRLTGGLASIADQPQIPIYFGCP